MFDGNIYFASLNNPILTSYKLNIERIKSIALETSISTNPFLQYFNRFASRILFFSEIETKICPDYFKKASFDQLLAENKEIHCETTEEGYLLSFANPAYAVKLLGEPMGQLFSSFYCSLLEYPTASFLHEIYALARVNQLFIEAYDAWTKNQEDYQTLKEIMTRRACQDIYLLRKTMLAKRYSPDFSYYTDIILHSDLSDKRYLFAYGVYISDNDLRIADFLNNYPVDKAEKVMKLTADAYIESFLESDKNYKTKKTASLTANVGMESLIRQLYNNLKSYDITLTISELATVFCNRQIPYDHRFDSALYLTKDIADIAIEQHRKGIEEQKGLLGLVSGGLYFDMFGEKPFSPENKSACLKLTEEQQELSKKVRICNSQVINLYYKREDTSFCIIGFPTPEIGDNFEEIFERTIDINMLESKTYLKIQQFIIDALDQADYVHVKGSGINRTDICVQMQPLTNPAKQTNFANCGATVNIPVGEVFNTPQLKGTNGTLHISSTYLNGLNFKNLTLDFKDGYVDQYSCTNFDTESENKKYIQENLLFPHNTLPIGEFAIGTNTLAYVVSQKYDILSKLPILIIEKMGPHFAIGDTCYSWEEDVVVKNPDGKEVFARDNERSILRKEDPSKAYTQIHTDITLPYNELAFISAVRKDGSTLDIIRDGRFVLPGTEVLNKPFDEA